MNKWLFSLLKVTILLDKIRSKIVVADTSYLVSLSDQNLVLRSFHAAALEAFTLFYINMVIRTELLKAVRRTLLIDAILALVAKSRSIELRYRALLTMPKADFTSISLSKNDAYNRVYKDHVRQGDLQLLLNGLKGNIWQAAESFERDTQLTYLGGTENTLVRQIRSISDPATQIFWDRLAEFMEETWLNSSDALIAEFAFSIGADAIVTTDTDFAQISDRIDILYACRKSRFV